MTKKARNKKALALACPDVDLARKLGEGGNAAVYAGTHITHGEVAVKFMLNSNTKRYVRFRDEVLIVTTQLLGSKYVLPILEYSLPSELLEADVPWYAMPIARRLTDALTDSPWLTRIQALVELAEGLASLHAVGIAHRDIKPENLFELDGSFRFGDFGLATFPEKAHITESNEPMGPWAYMAPEMLTTPKAADPFKADVYSFAKTAWAVLTKQRVPFFGHYAADTSIGLASFPGAKELTVEPLDALIEASTRVAPDERPTADAFAAGLKAMLAVQDDFRHTNKLEWEAAEIAALRASGLVQAVWQGAPAIAAVVSLLSRRHGLNHCFFPDGGGMALDGASACEGGEMLALHIESSGRSIVKPISLTLERFVGRPELSYAVLETADTSPLGVDNPRSKSGEAEFLWQLNEWDYGVDDRDADEPQNAGIGIFCERRFKGGSFVIAPTTGIFNQIDDYMGTEGKVGSLRAQFDEYALELSKQERASKSPVPRRTVRLLADSVVASYQLELQYIDQALLRQLIEVDDALIEERPEEGSPGLSLSLERRAAMIALYERTPEEAVAMKLLERMTKEQRAEFMTLVDLGRRNGRLARAKQITASNLEEDWQVDYLLEKLGNGYLRKALGRYGLEWPPSSPSQC